MSYLTGDWDYPSILRQGPDAERIECQAIVSGRWKPLSDPYWNDCVIKVRYRMRETTDA